MPETIKDLEKFTPASPVRILTNSFEKEQRRADRIFMAGLGAFLMVCLAILSFAGYGFAHFVGWAR